MKEKNIYYPRKRFDILESKEMILVFKKTFFGNLKWIASYNKDCFKWDEDKEMCIITELLKVHESKKR